jgi:hypothetical protein
VAAAEKVTTWPTLAGLTDAVGPLLIDKDGGGGGGAVVTTIVVEIEFVAPALSVTVSVAE